MKTSIWDILTGVVMLGILCLIGFFVFILINKDSPLNFLRPSAALPQVKPTIALPTNTATSVFPPTWTPVPTQENTKAPEQTATVRPSATLAPTNTFLVLPTFTPSKTPRTGLSGGTCEVVSQDPPDNKSINKNTTFDTRWTLKNTSSKDWRADSIDVRFAGGDRIHTGSDLRDMPADVAPGGTIDLVISMNSPSTSGSYVSNWQLSAGPTAVCNFYVTIVVP